MRHHKFKFVGVIRGEQEDYEVEVTAQANPAEPDVGYLGWWFEILSVEYDGADVTLMLFPVDEEELLDQAAMYYHDE